MLKEQKYLVKVDNYTIKEIIEKFRVYIQNNYGQILAERKPTLGILIGGYSTNKGTRKQNPDVFQISITNGVVSDIVSIGEKDPSFTYWTGEIEPLSRLLNGFGTGLPSILKESGLTDDKITQIMKLCQEKLSLVLVQPPMPIQDVIGLAIFMVELSEKTSQYALGPQTVGGYIEVAAITKHEGFKWIQRKHYFKKEFNVGANGE